MDGWQILIPFLLPHGWMANTHSLLATPWMDGKYSYPSCYPMDGWQILIAFLLPHGWMANTHTLLATPWRDGKYSYPSCYPMEGWQRSDKQMLHFTASVQILLFHSEMPTSIYPFRGRMEGHAWICRTVPRYSKRGLSNYLVEAI